MECPSKTIKFIIGEKYNPLTRELISKPVECYLRIGFLADDASFKHLQKGDICFIDLTVSKSDKELREYEVLISMANDMLRNGYRAKDIAKLLIDHDFEPQGRVMYKGEKHFYKSICDFIAKRLLDVKP